LDSRPTQLIKKKGHLSRFEVMALQTKLKKGMSRVRVPPETDCGRSMEYSVITWHAGKIIRI